MEPQNTPERPYRSHLRPACEPCRKRKSRCQTEAKSETCLMCRVHKTDCYFPEPSRKNPFSRSQSRRRTQRAATGNGAGPSAARSQSTASPTIRRRLNEARSTNNITSPVPLRVQHHHSTQDAETPIRLGSADDENLNPHIVGPAVTSDSQVLTDYLSGIPGLTRSTRMAIPESAGRSKPVLFTMVQKRPLGIAVHRSPSAEKLEIIEKLLEPCTDALINEYFRKINPCMPLLDEASFRRQFREHKEKISPALLACLYAHMVIYCKGSQALSRRPHVDGRYIWNLANEAVYSELHLSPGVSIITAILLNVGGRPTTSLIGNGVLLGSAVSIAHSLGLNHNPLDWTIPDSEKYLRMKIWWALCIHDKWTSLAHGTPPRISRQQQDVPIPTAQYLCPPNADIKAQKTASVFTALSCLTDVLDQYLRPVYKIDSNKHWSIAQFELALHAWSDSLRDSIRQVIVHGTNLDIPGASNLRLAYLSIKLLLQRISLEATQQQADSSADQVMSCYFQARQTAEEIIVFTQALRATQLNDFWLSVSAFAYPTTINFLLRHALETETSPGALAQSTSFCMARDLIDTLRSHQETNDWEMGDMCLAQHAEIVDKVLANMAPQTADADNVPIPENFVMPDASILDQFFPSLWDPLQNVW